MTDITLRGILGKKFGEKWKLNVSTVCEIFEAIEANTSKVSSCFKDVTKFSTHFFVLIDGKVMPYYLINSKILTGKNKVEIVPIVQGGGPMAVIFVIGLLLTVLSIVLTKMLSPKAPKDVKTSSTILGKIRNVTEQNVVIPICYGRLRVGSVVVSNYLTTKQSLSSYGGQDKKKFPRKGDGATTGALDGGGIYNMLPTNIERRDEMKEREVNIKEETIY